MTRQTTPSAPPCQDKVPDTFSAPEYVRLLGTPSGTLVPRPPAPYGHRNNQLHMYHHLGIYLHEHHATYLIEGVNVNLAKEVPFPTDELYSGELRVCEMPLQAGMSERELLELGKNCRVRFCNHLGHSWVADGETLSIDIDTYAERTRSGRKSRRRFLSYVSVGFRNAHR